MKKLIAIGAMSLALTTCSTNAAMGNPVASGTAQIVVENTSTTFINQLVQKHVDMLQDIKLRKTTHSVSTVVRQLKGRVGKTGYVFSGATPNGWDCSGLVMWAYEQLGVNLEHRASKQQYAGKPVSTPKVGDIVVFTYKGNKSAYHVGIYLDSDTMIHAGGGKGDRTSIVSISKFAGKYSKVTYRRILETI